MLRAAALAPPAFKTRLFARACSWMANLSFEDKNSLIRTNLGISSDLQCEIPLGKPDYIFGRPWDNLSERSTLALVEELSRDCSDFVDVGANEGIFTFLVNRHAGLNGIGLHWFEPDSDLYDRFARNLRLSGIASHGNAVAASDQVGVIQFFKNLTDDSSGSITDHFSAGHVTRVETVNTVDLADYLETNHIRHALLKVDVEGAGGRVWAGACRALERIEYLVMEMLAPEIAEGLPHRIISQSGFHAYYIRDYELVHSPDGGFDYKEPFWNWLFCRLTPDGLTKRFAGSKFRVVGG